MIDYLDNVGNLLETACQYAVTTSRTRITCSSFPLIRRIPQELHNFDQTDKKSSKSNGTNMCLIQLIEARTTPIVVMPIHPFTTHI
jgi:hypothetical protein